MWRSRARLVGRLADRQAGIFILYLSIRIRQNRLSLTHTVVCGASLSIRESCHWRLLQRKNIQRRVPSIREDPSGSRWNGVGEATKRSGLYSIRLASGEYKGIRQREPKGDGTDQPQRKAVGRRLDNGGTISSNGTNERGPSSYRRSAVLYHYTEAIEYSNDN